MVDKNLFFYDLTVVAIFKDEARYIKEWLDYHLLAGVDHFYLYNNDSSDNYQEVLAPYVEKSLVTLTDFPGKLMQYSAYNDAIEKYRFECRYMAFIDLDEFIFPKSNQRIVEVVDEILLKNPDAAALGVNWQLYGSNGQDKADYSRGVLERFTRRAPNNGVFISEDGLKTGNVTIKTIANPRLVKGIFSSHCADYFQKKFAVNSNGNPVPSWSNDPPLIDKIVVNHYFTKSREEFLFKSNRGHPDATDDLNNKHFLLYDRNEVFDDGILKYRAACEENFSLENDEERINRVTEALVEILTQPLPPDNVKEFFVDKLETFLTCRYVAEQSQIKIGEYSTEELALAWIYHVLIRVNVLTYSDLQLFIEVLSEIIPRPFPQVKDILQIFSSRLLPSMIDIAKNSEAWRECKNLRNLQRLLFSIQ